MRGPLKLTGLGRMETKRTSTNMVCIIVKPSLAASHWSLYKPYLWKEVDLLRVCSDINMVPDCASSER
jgi:hypothetical protein